MWKNERTHKNVSRVIRSDIPEILQNGSTLSPQRRNFQGGCKEKESLGSVFSQSSARTLKSEKRGAGSWAGFNKGYTTNGYRSANESSRNNGTGYGRRDSERVEPMPEWMEDGPDTNAEIMQLGGFEDQEKRLEESFQKLGRFLVSLFLFCINFRITRCYFSTKTSRRRSSCFTRIRC